MKLFTIIYRYKTSSIDYNTAQSIKAETEDEALGYLKEVLKERFSNITVEDIIPQSIKVEAL